LSRVVFMGTPDFAVPTLRSLIAHADYEVAGIVTQPDRPAGRGQSLRPSPVKEVAEAAGIPLFQPKTLRTPEAIAQLRAWQPEVIVVAAFGQILRQDVLDLPRHGCLNIHASLLPRWRGAAPIQAAIRAGDAESGITIMVMDAGLDTGPLLSQRAIRLDPHETGQTLHDKLAPLGASLLLETLPAYLDGMIQPRPQPHDESITLAPQIKKEEGAIDWSTSAAAIDRLVRAFTPWPGTYTFWNDRLLKVIAGEAAEGQAAPAQVLAHGDGIAIGTGDGLYVPILLQLAGKKALPTADFLRGNPAIINSRLG
jgi:methionyl-tRNA formyltransferase